MKPTRVAVLSVLAIALCASACSGRTEANDPIDASTDMDAALDADDDANDGGESTWTSLYRDYFGLSGVASCAGAPTAAGGCHASRADTGSLASGFNCGMTQESCYAGITAPQSIVPAGGSATPETTLLYRSLRSTLPPQPGISPQPQSSTFAFSSADLQRIAEWIQRGAMDD
jgi:hypothetical protein